MIKTILITALFFWAFVSNAQKIFQKNDRYGIQDDAGKTIVRAKYDEIDEFKYELFGQSITNPVTRIKEKFKWGIINISTGKEVLEPIFDNIKAIGYLSISNLLDVQLNGKWGVYNFEGKEIVAPKYFEPVDVSTPSNYSVVTLLESVVVASGYQKKLYGLLDSNYKEIITPKYGFLKHLDGGLFKASSAKEPKLFGIIDEMGSVLFEFKYEDVFVISKDIITLKKLGKWSLINRKGFSLNSSEYEGLAKLRSKRALVIKNGKYGFIDEKGKEVIPCKYDKAETFFYEGKVKVKLNYQTFEIDINGNEITNLNTLKPRNSLFFENRSQEQAFDLINFKENVADSANLKRIAKYLEEANPSQYYKTHIKAIDNLMSEATNNKNAYKVVANYLYNKFTKTEYVCHDAILVHISLKYICNDDAPYGGAYWLEPNVKKQILEYANVMNPILCGEIMTNFYLKLLPQIASKNIRLHSISAKYTILYIWQNNCDFCEKQLKLLAANYTKLKEKGLEVVGVSLSTKEIDKCEQFIVQQDLNWINAIDVDKTISKTFNISSAPMLILLDKDKRIIFKDISVKNVIDYLEQ
jgi:peroxiredoxin